MDSRTKGRSRLVSLRETHQETREDMQAEAVRFSRLKDKETASPAVFSSFNLFQTPAVIVGQVIELAEIEPGQAILEPSAGLGRLIQPIADCRITAVEIDLAICNHLRKSFPAVEVIHGDFLEWSGRKFDRIVMNPPFKMGRDVKHIRHAISMLANGGRLVSVCMNGPKQRAAIQPIADQWIELGTGAFKSEGTNVDTAIFVKSLP